MGLKGLSGNKILVIFILLIGTTLRFYKLDLRSLWYDEAAKISPAKHQYSLAQFFQQHRDAKKPAYIFLLKIWMKAFGESELSVRGPSVICGILSIAFLYLLAAEFFSKSIGLIASFFLSISPFHIYYSQQNLEYSLLLFLVILSTLLFVRILKRQKKIYFLFYAITSVLLCYTHMFGLYIVLIHTACLFLFQKDFFRKREWLVTQGFLFISIAPLFYFIFIRGPQANEMDWISRPGIYSILDTIKAVTYGGKKLAQGGVGPETGYQRLLLARLLMFICSLLLLKGIFSYRNYLNYKKSPSSISIFSKNKIILLIVWITLPPLITLIFSFFVFPIYVVRYFIIIMPAYLMLLAVGISRIKRLKVMFTMLFLMVILNSQALWVYFNPGEIASWREIAAYVKEKVLPGDMLVFLPLKQIVPFVYYFSDTPGRSLEHIDIEGKKIDGKWYSMFREGEYRYTGVKLGDLPYEVINSQPFKISEKKANKIFLITSPYWPGIGQTVYIVRNYLLKNSWQEDEFFYPYPGVKLFIYNKKTIE